ncbi:hypothetical protein B0T14DRAFT_339016 [Immersiella caudata]|uniref:Uncharacterized protein n=1 Tax=Immersiella caudata TaxID=314043 RepID=A0AA39U541_9PEZI|nr:hypothetical protein B0T14DRAFT_339016 [Immersiella caudata]
MTSPELQPLLQVPDGPTWEKIVNCFFGNFTSELGCANMETYSDYYVREIRRLQVGVAPGLARLAARTHEDLIHICEVLSKGRTRARQDIRKELLSYFATKDHLAVDRSIDLTLRLWLLLNVRDSQLSVLLPEQPPLLWEDSCSLETFIEAHFRRSTTKLGYRESRLDPSFTVANMVRVCDLRVRWTESIDDHLRLDQRRRVLSIFPMKGFLVGQLNSAVVDGDGNKVSKVLPASLLQETVITLNLLFPQWDSATQALLRQDGQRFDSEAPFDGPRRQSLDEFSYWRDRLLELHEEIYKASPGTWGQLWRDRRNPHNWWTFWIVLLVIVPLTIVGTIASVVQSQAAVESLNLQRASVSG